MEPILTIDNLNSFGGNMLRQGDKSQLKYRLRDVGNKNLNISGKSCEIKMYGRNYTTVVYETTTTVTTENTVSFTIDKVLPKGTFYLEFTVGDYIFPTDHREFFEITPSGKGVDANVIEIVGKDVLINAVKSQVDTELQPLVTTLESAEQAEVQRASAESSRASAEEQREIDHANRSAELDSKADKVVIKNLVTLPLSHPHVEDFEGDTSDVWYAYVEARYTKYNSGRTRLTLRNYGSSSNVALVEFTPEVSEDFKSYSVRADGKINGTRLILSTDLSTDLELDTRNLIVLNLTETFGAGNEPTQEEMDELIKVAGYDDSENGLNVNDMLGYLMVGKANRSAELAGKADKVVIENLIPNGDFTTNENVWLGNASTTNVVDGKLVITSAGTVGSPNAMIGYGMRTFPNGADKYYVYSKVKVTNDNASYMTVYMNASGRVIFMDRVNTPVKDREYVIGGIIESHADWIGKPVALYFLHSYASAEDGNGQSMEVSQVIQINLTQTFGAGNEPTREEMDELIEVTGYIDGEYVLNNKEMLGHLMDVKASKKQEDWITPTLINGWEQQSAYEEVGYYKDDFGVVHLRGTVRNGEANTYTFTLPTGYRPSKFVFYPVLLNPTGSRMASVYIDSKGGVYSYHTAESLSLDHISFMAER